MLLLFVSFFAGVVTVLAPCILPLLPVVVGGSFISNEISKKKSFVVILSLGVSIIIFTFLLKVSTLFISVPEFFWKLLSGSIVIAIGLLTLFPRLWESKYIMSLNVTSNKLLGKGDMKKSVWGDVLVGAALGPVFSTCSPTYFIILAAVLPVSPILGSLYILVYVIGLCLSLFIITFFSSKIMSKLGNLSDPQGYFKKLIGALFIIVGIVIISGLDKRLQVSILDNGYFEVTKIEQAFLEYRESKIVRPWVPTETALETSTLEKEKIDSASNVVANEKVSTVIKNDDMNTINGYEQSADEINANVGLILAPDISTPDSFINTNGKAITLTELRGKKVVLVSFWTYSCINCKRTLPYLNNWYEKYKDQGLEIVSIHTPEFAFEKVKKNVEDAVRLQSIQYPVVLDNDFSTWRSYENQYWPRKYLVNKDGYIIYDHAGEGDYEETEQQIVQALQGLNN